MLSVVPPFPMKKIASTLLRHIFAFLLAGTSPLASAQAEPLTAPDAQGWSQLTPAEQALQRAEIRQQLQQ